MQINIYPTGSRAYQHIATSVCKGRKSKFSLLRYLKFVLMVLPWMQVMTIHLIKFSELKGVQKCHFKSLPCYNNIFSD